MVDIQKRRLEMEEASPFVIIPKMALPTILAMLVDSLYNLADAFFVSGLGENATAAVAVNDSFMNILLAIGSGFAFGCASYVSRLLGAREDEHASTVASTTFFTGLITAVVMLIVLWPIRRNLVMALGSTAESAQYSVDYATWIILALPFTMGSGILNQTLKSEGNTTYSMIGMMSGCIVNCALDPLFINVFGWEVAGAAGATALSKMMSFIILVIPFVRKRTLVHISLKRFKFNSKDFTELLKTGIPAFLKASMISIGGIVTNRAARAFGTSILAGISIANKLYKLVASSLLGFGQGYAPIAGYCYGAKKYNRVKKLYGAVIIIGSVLCGILSVLMWIFSKDLVNLFNGTNNPEITRIAVFKLKVLCIAFIPHMFVVATNHLYQALGRPIGNTLLSLSRQLLVLVPLVKILPNYFGAWGVAGAQGLSDVISGVFIALPGCIIMVHQLNKLEKEQSAQ